MINILMIEDDVELGELLCDQLIKENISVTLATTPLKGLELFKQNSFDALVLDLSLPQMDGQQICRLIRKESDIPILISSARGDLHDKSEGFAGGADDFLPKPYDPQELAFRLEAILRRVNPGRFLSEHPFIIDEVRQEITKNGLLLTLTPAEYEVLAYFIKKDRHVITREELLLNINSIRYESSLKSIDVLMGRIRSKIGDNPKNPEYLLAIRGQGYKFVNQ
ncbi:response regulator transcription factor [Sulfurimonas sp.]